ncbi:MAG: glycosyltransferase family 2 protein, partial [Patescibacteria group bacterium]
MKIAAVIPAYNEEKNIARVLRAVQSSVLFSEIIAVDDGSTDGTADVIHAEGVRVIRQENQGKAGAMATGVRATDADAIFFADADLIGLGDEHIAAVIQPVVDGRAGMTVGIRGWGNVPQWMFQHILPVIGGERAIRREHFLKLSAHPAARRYGIETVMNVYCKLHDIPVILVRM